MKLILASNSPRRKELLAGLDIPFVVSVIDGIDESFPETIDAKCVAEYVACKKAEPYKKWFEDCSLVPDNIELNDDTVIITADTVVVCEDKIMGKPTDGNDAAKMLAFLSGKKHQVYTGVCLLSARKLSRFTVCTNVEFRHLLDNEINYYIDNYKPYDKAGSYGIQEWIGYIGVKSIEGSYYNVMGLPVQRIFDELKHF